MAGELGLSRFGCCSGLALGSWNPRGVLGSPSLPCVRARRPSSPRGRAGGQVPKPVALRTPDLCSPPGVLAGGRCGRADPCTGEP